MVGKSYFKENLKSSVDFYLGFIKIQWQRQGYFVKSLVMCYVEPELHQGWFSTVLMICMIIVVVVIDSFWFARKWFWQSG